LICIDLFRQKFAKFAHLRLLLRWWSFFIIRVVEGLLLSWHRWHMAAFPAPMAPMAAMAAARKIRNRWHLLIPP
jgi:hypothetical protein